MDQLTFYGFNDVCCRKYILKTPKKKRKQNSFPMEIFIPISIKRREKVIRSILKNFIQKINLSTFLEAT